MIEARCKACDRKIAWVRNPETGKKVPLDLESPVYRLGEDGGFRAAIRDRDAFVNHFRTCTDPNRFSKQRAP